MTAYNLTNNSDKILRIILEPEAIEHDLKPKDQIKVIASGNNSAFECKYFTDREGINCIAFWPDQGQVVIQFNGKNIIDNLGKLNSLVLLRRL